MTFFSIVVRELRLRARQPRTYQARMALAVMAALLCLGMLLAGGRSGGNPSEISRTFFLGFSAVAWVWSMVSSAIYLSDSLSRERREGTLGLLFLTDLNGADVLLGKWVAGGVPVALALLASLPILAMAFFLGGVAASQFWQMTLTIAVTTVFAQLLALAFSAWVLSARRAMALSLASLGAIAAVGLIDRSGTGLAWLGWVPSPGHLFGPSSGWVTGHSRFSFSLWGLLVVSVVLFFGTARRTQHAWREVPSARPEAGPTRAPASTIGPWRGPKLGESDPIRWLALRLGPNRRWLAYFWLGSGVLWLGGVVLLKVSASSNVLLFGLLYVWHGLIKMWIALECSHRWCEDRSTGALEILLTTPLTARRLYFGWMTGLFSLLGWPCLALLAMDLHLWLQSGAGQELMALVLVVGVFVADAYALVWVGMWQGVQRQTPARAFLATVQQVFVLPWVVFAGLILLLITVSEGQWLSAPVVVLLWFLTALLVDMLVSAWSMHRLSDESERGHLRA